MTPAEIKKTSTDALRDIAAACKAELAERGGAIQDAWPEHQALKAKCTELEAQLDSLTAYAVKLEQRILQLQRLAKRDHGGDDK